MKQIRYLCAFKLGGLRPPRTPRLKSLRSASGLGMPGCKKTPGPTPGGAAGVGGGRARGGGPGVGPGGFCSLACGGQKCITMYFKTDGLAELYHGSLILVYASFYIVTSLHRYIVTSLQGTPTRLPLILGSPHM